MDEADEEKKEDIWFSPMTKSLYNNRTFKTVKLQHKNATQKIDYTTVTDRLRTVSRD